MFNREAFPASNPTPVPVSAPGPVPAAAPVPAPDPVPAVICFTSNAGLISPDF